MNKFNKKALTLVEIMIMVVILSLLASMAIPAVRKVKLDSIARMAIEGKTLDYDSEMYLRENFDRLSAVRKSHLDRETLKPIAKPDAQPRQAQTIIIDGKTYYIVPKE